MTRRRCESRKAEPFLAGILGLLTKPLVNAEDMDMERVRGPAEVVSSLSGRRAERMLRNWLYCSFRASVLFLESSYT